MDFEKKLKSLEDIVEKMESGDLSLDKSLELFEQGVKLSKDCHGQLNEAEKKVQTLLGVDSSGAAKTQDFSAED